MDPYRVIKRPHISEKGHEYTQEHNTYVFRVDREATKTDIRKAIEDIWGVKIQSIRTINVPKKTRRYGRAVGQTASWKKALVRLREGEAIEVLR